MPTTAERNAVFDVVKKDVEDLVDELVPAMFRGTVQAELTTQRILKIVDDGIAALDNMREKEHVG